jgi:hypothetical protein
MSNNLFCKENYYLDILNVLFSKKNDIQIKTWLRNFLMQIKALNKNLRNQLCLYKNQ